MWVRFPLLPPNLVLKLIWYEPSPHKRKVGRFESSGSHQITRRLYVTLSRN
ncbi:hypothetical protein vBSenS3_105 [Salmonella phage vB_SenS-3]|nr:hypothetical protein vBSenS3_105 [Salmonella phage vB_SenS-3]